MGEHFSTKKTSGGVGRMHARRKKGDGGATKSKEDCLASGMFAKNAYPKWAKKNSRKKKKTR